MRGIRSAFGTVAAACLLGAFLPVGAASAAPSAPVAKQSCVTPIFETDGYKHGKELGNFANFNSHVPAGYEAHPVSYQDGIFPGIDPKTLDQATKDGTAKLDSAVRAFHARCPGSTIVIAGYSEGAIVAGDELNALSKSNAIPHDLIHGVLYGDPRRPFGDGGVGGVAGGVETNLPTILPGVTMNGPRGFGDLAVHEICNENDAICNSANMITNALAFANGWAGYASGDHGYDLNPARDQGSGLTLNHQQPRINYGPPLPVDIGTPWQIQHQLGDTAGARAKTRAAMATVNAALPVLVKQKLQANPWYKLLNQA